MKILPVISPKGGEGKSTFAAYLAGFLADAGVKTLLIDADWTQPTASSIFALNKEALFGLYELLMQTIPDPVQAISQTSIDNLDLIYSNDPDELLPTAMLHAADGRIRLRNILQHPAFSRYGAIIIDSKGATGVMTELSILASTGRVMGVVKPILPDVREFIRGSLHMFSRLKTYENYGIHLPEISILVNCFENTLLDREAMDSLSKIISEKLYDSSVLGERRGSVCSIPVSSNWISSNWAMLSHSQFTGLNIKPGVRDLRRQIPCTALPASCFLSGKRSLMTSFPGRFAYEP